jgi:hypothetical protein
MALIHLLAMLQRHPNLQHLSLLDLATFIRLASLLKRDILQPQPLSQTHPDNPPDVLPRSVSQFLSSAVGIPLDDMEYCWDVLKEDVWCSPPIQPVSAHEERLFKEFGWRYGLSESHMPPLGLLLSPKSVEASLTLYPPHKQCTNPRCRRVLPLKKEQQRQAVVYTTSSGVRPVWSVHVSCPGILPIYGFFAST